MTQHSAIPWTYWIVFGWYEPLLTLLGCAAVMLYPKEIHDQQAPWPSGSPPNSPLSRATLVTLLQLAQTVGLLGLVNFLTLGTARRHLARYPAIQERMVAALLTPLLLGDISHMAITLWALGEERWDTASWRDSTTLWLTMLTGMTLLCPRIAWHLGIGRYMHKRDGKELSRIKGS
ncbi:hypothetical protein BXZ70DRAFT_904004 [Cristinia sonorae]|uniref:DUF7704 domain-containing protein n=1 Tax=Cristinia sonorae TaxID=1940300 RepID=A0A8K0XTQ6_9AGAR|nr:hypothetical protein BXZ70DRAFT_904004 [Cristinia sonorae]